MIYFWAMKGRSGQINVNNGKIVSEVITFVSDKDIKRMGGLERRIDKLNNCECFCYPKRLKFRNVFSTVKAELDDEDFEQIDEILRQKKGKLSKEDIYNLKKLWKELQFVKVKHLQQFGELLEYHRELLEEERDCENPYFHYACDYLELIENKEIKDGFLVITQD
ncbi:hypothetical protein ABK040_000301 [Willaertia magna]